MEVKIALALPTNRGVRPKCLQSLLELVDKTPCEVIVATEGFNTAENRTWLVAQASKRDCTHIFFVDDDMVYEPDTLEKLLKRDRDIVGAAYANRRGDGEVVERFEEVTQDRESIHKVKAIGGGCLLVKMSVFEKVSQPWFWYKVNDNGSVQMSNDWWFCEKAIEAGYDVWCDPHVKPGHLGLKEL